MTTASLPPNSKPIAGNRSPEIGAGNRSPEIAAGRLNGFADQPDAAKGAMAATTLETLLNNISHFGHLSSSNKINSELVQRYFRRIDEIFIIVKPIFDVVVGSEIALDAQLNKVLGELDANISEASELIESWHQMMSKIYFVLRIESSITKIRMCVLETCRLLGSVLSSSSVNLISACIEEIQHMHNDQISDVIKEAIRDQIEKAELPPENMEKISTSLNFSSNQELLMELVALEKHKAKVGRGESHVEVENIDHMIALATHMHDCLLKVKQLHSINGVPIPADFCCPLSLELMSDPVIVASGQTYERAFIRKWLEEGFNVCPKTRQTLTHSNLIPNYTVKALIANWCESNDIKLPDPVKSMSASMPSAFINSNGPTADSNIPFPGHLARTNHVRSLEVNKYMMNSHKDSISSNGLHQETRIQERSRSPNHHLVSAGSPLHAANGINTEFSKISIGSSERKKESSSDVGSGSHTSNQLKHDGQASIVGDHMQGSNRNVSVSSSVSSNEHLQGVGDATMVSRVSSDLTHYSSDASGELAPEAPTASAPQREPEFPQMLPESRSRSQTIWRRPSERFAPRIVSSPSMDSRADLSELEAEVRKLVDGLKSDSTDVQRASTAALRLLAKHNMENRIIIASSGAITLLVGLLHSTDLEIQENAVTALLNLSINDNNKASIANAEAIKPLIYVLETGNHEAKENSAATLFSLSVIEENKVKIGRSGAIKPLVELLGNGTPRGKKDAATALFNLSIFHENKARIVQAGAVRHLVELMDPAAGMVDKAVAVLANLATIPEGRSRIGQEGGIPVLVEVVELGSARGKENAAAALLQLCTNSNRFCSMVLQEGAVPPLVALSQSGTARAKEKAQALLSYFRNQRHGNAGRA